MSAPASHSHPAAFPPGPYHPLAAPPRSNGPRIHAIVALSVIGGMGGICAVLAFLVGIFSADACHQPGDFACRPFVGEIIAFGSVPAVLAGIALACVGLARARRGGGHAPVVAAWVAWGGFCLVWWVLVGML